jgi:hypothetical protein
MNKLILILHLVNFFVNLTLIFWLVNKNCSACQAEKSPQRIFTFKNLCLNYKRSNYE